MNTPAKLLGTLQQHWGWSGLQAREIIGRNAFGNLLVIDDQGLYWRICPEELFCGIAAQTAEEFARLSETEEFRLDWDMERLVEKARRHVGALDAGWVYCFVIPPVFGGAYEVDNIKAVPIEQLVAFSGDWAQEIKDLPDGAQIKLRVID